MAYGPDSGISGMDINIAVRNKLNLQRKNRPFWKLSNQENEADFIWIQKNVKILLLFWDFTEGQKDENIG